MSRFLLVLLLVVLFGGVTGYWILDVYGHRGTDFWTGAIIHGVATLPYVLLCRAAVKGRYKPKFAHALAVSVGLRLLALPLQPALSDDIYRYMHEGTMVLKGQNPYLTPPASVADDLRHPEYWSRINHPEVPAAYPPTIQYALAAAVLISPTPMGMKILFGLCDLLIFLLLWRWLPEVGVRKELAVVHGFCPLMVLEFTGEGHGDSLTVLFVLLCLYAFVQRKLLRSGALLAVATLGKFLPGALLPFVMRRDWRAIVPFGLVVVLFYLPFVRGLDLSDWPDLSIGTQEYVSRWRGNDSVFHVLHDLVRWVLGVLEHYGVDVGNLKYYPHQIAKVPILIFGLAIMILAWVRDWPLEKVAACLFMLFVSLTPTMHPWYMAFLVPFLCLYPNTFWLIFTGTIFLAYHVRPEWITAKDLGVSEDIRLKFAEYAPFYAGFVGVLMDTRSGVAEGRKRETD